MRFSRFRRAAGLSLLICASAIVTISCNVLPVTWELKQELRRAGVADAIDFRVHSAPINETHTFSRELMLTEAVHRALQTDPNVQAAFARFRVAEAEALQSRLLPNPIVSIGARFPENSGKPVIEAELGLELLALLQRPGRISAADHRLRSTAADVVSTVLDAIAEVEDNYASVQSLDAQMPVLNEQRDLVARLHALAEDRLRNGEGTRLDVTTLDSQLISVEVDLAEKRLSRRQERLRLARLLGEPSGEANWKLSAWSEPAQIGSEIACIRAALEHRPEVSSQRWELAALGAETRLARFSPFEPAEIGAKAERDVGEPWAIGPALSIPLPLFDWGQARCAKATALQSEAEHKLTKISRTVIEEVRSAHAAYLESMSTLELAQKQLVPAEERRRNETEAAFLAGLTDIAALILAEQDLQASRIKLIELQHISSAAAVKLRRAVGGSGVAAILANPPSSTQPASVTTSSAVAPIRSKLDLARGNPK